MVLYKYINFGFLIYMIIHLYILILFIGHINDCSYEVICKLKYMFLKYILLACNTTINITTYNTTEVQRHCPSQILAICCFKLEIRRFFFIFNLQCCWMSVKLLSRN